MRNFLFIPCWLFILCCLFSPAAGQSVDEHFHSGAGHYIDGRYPQALNEVEDGLLINPSDPKLLALKEQIEEAMQQQASAGGQTPDQPPEGGGDEQDQQEQQGQGTADDQQEDAPAEDGSDGDDSAADQGESGGDPEQDDLGDQRLEDEETGPGDLDRMSREDAERILQALELDEKELLREAQQRRTRQGRVYPDW